MSKKLEISREEAEVCCFVSCMYCGKTIRATFDDTSIEEITPAGHGCKGVVIAR
jgi:hypothetical protein